MISNEVETGQTGDGHVEVTAERHRPETRNSTPVACLIELKAGTQRDHSTVVAGLIFVFRHCTDREVRLVESPNRRSISLDLRQYLSLSNFLQHWVF